jgi:hypothetical protein
MSNEQAPQQPASAAPTASTPPSTEPPRIQQEPTCHLQFSADTEDDERGRVRYLKS